jgi:hypothetical protein
LLRFKAGQLDDGLNHRLRDRIKVDNVDNEDGLTSSEALTAMLTSKLTKVKRALTFISSSSRASKSDAPVAREFTWRRVGADQRHCTDSKGRCAENYPPQAPGCQSGNCLTVKFEKP